MLEGLSIDTSWRKSSFSSGANGGSDCVEVATLDDSRVAVRDSKRPDHAVLFSARSEMAAFLRGVKAREFDILG